VINVIRRPLISKKNRKHLKQGVYVFEVNRQSTKIDIKKAVEKLFRVKVVSVRTILSRTKGRRTKAGVGKPQYFKKAMIKLAPNNKIGLFEGV